MADHSKIEWTDATWPIVQGCDPVSQGCVGCYAVPLLWRMSHVLDLRVSGPLQGVVEKHANASGETVLRFTGKLALREDRLDWPLKWKQPKMIFVPSHGDIFHKDVPDEFLLKIFDVMRRCSYDGGSNTGLIDKGAGEHTFQVLTKRAERMRNFMPRLRFDGRGEGGLYLSDDGKSPIVLKNVWLGVSAEDQANADERIPLLLQTPAAVRFVSLEPLLGAINLVGVAKSPTEIWDALRGNRPPFSGGEFDARFHAPAKLDWVIVGGESGPKARPMHPDWARSLRDQCEAAGVAFFFKQWGAWAPGIWSGSGDPAYFDALDASLNVPDMSDHDAWCSRVHWFDRNQEPDGPGAIRVGKKGAGRLLDGVEHNGFPNHTST